MSRMGKIARRTFLFGAVAVAGGVAFGTYVVRKPHDNPLEAGASEAVLTPWVRITSDGITLITPHADVGQGVYSLQAALIAEELDLEFGQFDIDPGPPAAAYFNTALGKDGVPFLITDESFTANAMRGAMSSVIKVLGMQVTGGSSSVPDSFVKLRQAGAMVRETLKAAASARTGVAIGDLKTEGGQVLLPDGTTIDYTDLAQEVAEQELVSDVTLRDPSEWRLIGKDMQRLDIVAKSTGTLPYGLDLKMDGMVHATTRVSPRRGDMLSFDASAAKDMPGVSDVIEITGGVAVLADNTWRAFQAADAIDITWGPAPYPAEQDDHWKAVEASFTEDNLNKVWADEGDVDEALASGEVFEAEYRAPYVAHQPLEPLNALVLVSEDKVDVWAGHQIPRFVQTKVAAITGHEAEQVVFHNQYSGGSFGHRLEFDFITQAAEIANKYRGTPIKLTLKREEDFATDYPRQIGMARVRGKVADGKVAGLSLDIATVSSTASQSARMGVPVGGPDTQIAAGAWNNRYDIPDQRVRGYIVPELAPTSSWRSVGASTGGFFADAALDELIHAAGADPMEERIRLMRDPLSRKVLEAVAEMSGWGRALGENKGLGVSYVESFGVRTAEVVEVTNDDGAIRIDKVWVAAEIGRVIDPINFENNVMGGVIWGLGHAINGEVTYSDGIAEPVNFYAHDGLRMYQCPEIEVLGLENGDDVRGIGEPPVPPAAPALANAIFAATGQRLREMPFNRHIDFI